ncbi:MAG: 30S ribosomal protein S12 methylthiotransferase RimO [Lachnospiraceae bacterium]|nr:30S ribosomal protein S12 methylthiotransferase RimO [Lachnospiraceae bacterium]
MNIFFMSLGCDKNLVDSEMMISSLRKNDFLIVNDPEEADVIVVNTCCFIGDAKEESINSLIELAEYKERRCKLLVATGCLAQRYSNEISEDIPEVDIIIGTMAYDKLTDAINEKLKELENVESDDKALAVLEDIDRVVEPDVTRESLSGSYSAYLKISEGCNKRCTYCIIPYVRGSYRSFPMENLVKQAEKLCKEGAKELILVAQETTLYGVDLYGEKSLHKLIQELSKVPGLRWIRLLYCYPEEIYDGLIEEFKNNPKLVNYIDMPIQHASDNVLRKMGRRTDKKALLEVIGKLRKEVPDITLRTTLITGFPGETEEDFKELKGFVEEVRFERLGVFTYSQEEGTPAAEFEDQVEEEIKQERCDEIMEIQQDIAFDNANDAIGEELIVLIEGYLPEEDVYIGRSYKDAPEVDGFVFVDSDIELESGDFVKVDIVKSKGYDLLGDLIEAYK